MNQEEYLKFHTEVCEQARALSMSKNTDYSAPGRRPGDPYAIFANFMQAERYGLCTVEQGILVRISDKISRMCSLIHPEHLRAVLNESLRDAVMDTINYLILMLAYLDTRDRVGVKGGRVESASPEAAGRGAHERFRS